MAPLPKHHPKVKRLRRLVGHRSAREAERAFVLEGAKVVSEALRGGAVVESLYLSSGSAEPELVGVALARGVRVFELAPEVIGYVADTVTPQPVLAVAANVDVGLPALREATLVVVCVDVRDPGNAGTILRSAEAAGAGGVVFCTGSVDVYNPKTVRASAGALFYVPIVAGGDPLEVLEEMGRWGLRRLGASAHGGAAHTAVDFVSPTALVVGNEAHGLPSDVGKALDGQVTIPVAGRSESLNVGMAAAVLCFEAARQRGLQGVSGGVQ